MELTTDRLILRPWETSDAEELYKYAKDDRVGPMAGWPVHTSVENSKEIIAGVLSEPETYAVVLKNTGLPVGSAGIMRKCTNSAPKMTDDEVEIGYWIGVPYWGQGLIPEAVIELQKRAFVDLGVAGIWCAYFDGNEKSKRVQEKCGFIYQYTSKEPIYGLHKDKFEHFTYLSKKRWEELRGIGV